MNNFYKFAEEAIETAGKTGERKRQFRAQTASDLARSRMAELERSETGATKRQAMLEAGKEKRHEREYGRPGIGDPGGFRYVGLARTEAGKEARHLREHGPEGTATQRLSWVKEQAAKEKAAKDFTIRAGGIMGKYITRTETGEMLDPKMEPIYREAQAMAIDDPSKAVEFLSGEVSRFEKTDAERTRFMNLPTEQLELLRAEEVERKRVSQLTPEARAGEEAVQSAAKRAAGVRRLRAEYEEENAPPSIFGRLSEAWKGRKQYPATVPIGLR